MVASFYELDPAMNRHNVKNDELFGHFITHGIELFDRHPFSSRWIAPRYSMHPMRAIHSGKAWSVTRAMLKQP
jgi:hypothetical protein